MTFAGLLASAGVEEHVALAGPFGFLAFHGGLEGGTAEVAQAAAEASGASLYLVVQPPTLRWHIPSHRVNPDHSAALAGFLEHVHVAVAIHGYGRPDRADQLLLGGGNRALAADLASELRRIDGFVVVDDLEAIPREMRGLHPDNPVNRPAGGGVQLELPPRARGASPHPADRGLPCVPAPGLIEALAQVAGCWDTSPGAGPGAVGGR